MNVPHRIFFVLARGVLLYRKATTRVFFTGSGRRMGRSGSKEKSGVRPEGDRAILFETVTEARKNFCSWKSLVSSIVSCRISESKRGTKIYRGGRYRISTHAPESSFASLKEKRMWMGNVEGLGEAFHRNEPPPIHVTEESFRSKLREAT